MGIAAAIGMVLCYHRTMPLQNTAQWQQWGLEEKATWQLCAFQNDKRQAKIINRHT